MSTLGIASRQRAGLSVTLVAASILLVPLFVEAADLPSWPVCLLRHLTGMPCPACGLTHAILAAGRGDWLESMRWHPLGPMAWLAVVACCLIGLRAWLLGLDRPAVSGTHFLAAVGLLAVVWVARLVW